jgi:hypothetical protein
MNFTRHEMVEIAEDLRTVIQAGRLSTLWHRLNPLLQELRQGIRPAPWECEVAADELARQLSMMTGTKPFQWRASALEALGFPDRASIAVEAIREMADEVHDEHAARERRHDVTIRRPAEPAPARPSGPAPIHVTVGQRKRGGR